MGIRTYPPREGTETQGWSSLIIFVFSIRTYPPREGTETASSKSLRIDCKTYKNLSTSRGDGNITRLPVRKSPVDV